MITALSSDSSDFVSLFSHNGTRLSSGGSRSSEAMSPSSTELSDDSSLTNDDLVVLSDLFGFSNGGTTASHLKAKRTTKTTPRTETSAFYQGDNQ
ncbi:hypothetical protein P3T76_010248 [Phytophthora citrophthora]|uniref:Uncharacterized protein n=1 Tax=Phytophthora citrophthora TaxID=4793 RepID=A0AAD9GBM4_9STRA|nr:hypothetical protein P3T76_010248 [Phytophthora citrophthora]